MSRAAIEPTNDVTPADSALFHDYAKGLIAWKNLVDGSNNPANSAGTNTTANTIQISNVPILANRAIRVVVFGIIKLDATGVAAGNGVQIGMMIDSVVLRNPNFAVPHYTPGGGQSALGAALEGRAPFHFEATLQHGAAQTRGFTLFHGVAGSGGTAQVLGVADTCGLYIYDDGPSLLADS